MLNRDLLRNQDLVSKNMTNTFAVDLNKEMDSDNKVSYMTRTLRKTFSVLVKVL